MFERSARRTWNRLHPAALRSSLAPTTCLIYFSVDHPDRFQILDRACKWLSGCLLQVEAFSSVIFSWICFKLYEWSACNPGGTPYDGLYGKRLRPKEVSFSGFRFIKG